MSPTSPLAETCLHGRWKKPYISSGGRPMPPPGSRGQPVCDCHAWLRLWTTDLGGLWRGTYLYNGLEGPRPHSHPILTRVRVRQTP